MRKLGYSLEVAEFTEEGARCDDAEARSEAPDETAQDGDDFVSEELCSSLEYVGPGSKNATDRRERDDEEDTYWYRPAVWEAAKGMHLAETVTLAHEMKEQGRRNVCDGEL